MLSRKITTAIAVGVTAIAFGGAGYGIVSSTSSTSPAAASPATSSSGSAAVRPATTGKPGKTGSNARSGPAAGGAAGTVRSVSASGFTIVTPAGQNVTVDKTSSTRYQNGTSPASSSAITAGAPVLVLGTTNGTTITATQVMLQPAGAGGSATSSTTKVVPFKRGAPSPAKQVGQVPSSYTQGSGTIVSGTTASKATAAALAAYPGGVVNRVVKLSNGDYEVHNVGVNWPHHIFVDGSFKVIGAN